MLEKNAIKHRFAVIKTLDPAFAMYYLRFFNWLVKSLISMKESFSEEFQAPLQQILLPIYLLQFPSSAAPVKNKKMSSQNILTSLWIDHHLFR